MTAALAATTGVLGLLVGSFLNVVVWRVPRGESVAHPPSHCPSCDARIRPYDNVPVVSWLLLRGRCRDCSSPISPRYPAVELLTGALFAATALRFGLDSVLPAYLYLAAIAVALALIDLDTHRLPDAVTLPSYAVVPALLGLAAATGHGGTPWVRALLGGAALYAVYFVLWFASGGKGMGFGDVKLAGVLGMYLGWLSWGEWGAGLLLGFFAGGLTGVALMAAGRAGRKTAIPYGPFMILGALAAVFFGEPIVDVWLR